MEDWGKEARVWGRKRAEILKGGGAGGRARHPGGHGHAGQPAEARRPGRRGGKKLTSGPNNGGKRLKFENQNEGVLGSTIHKFLLEKDKTTKNTMQQESLEYLL